MITRKNTKKVKIGNIYIGGSENVLIQSMCDIKTSNIEKVIEQINNCEKLGADIMRVSVLDEIDAISLKEIKKHTNIPLVADIHYSKKLALLAIENGADKIRVNPGNIDSSELDEIIDSAKKHQICIRIGVNSGSLSKKYCDSNMKLHEKMVASALEFIKYFEEKDFTNLVISLKSSDPLTTLKAYRLASQQIEYPLHIGVTESGFDEIGIIKSVSVLSPLLLEGIGDTIRISLTQDPQKEIITAKRLLNSIGIHEDLYNLISCPTCGRCKVYLKPICIEIDKFLQQINKKISVAIMGCVVNGIGEGKNADIGIAGGDKEFILFKKGEIIRTIKQKDIIRELKKEIENF